jgi:hypothetical protein
MRNLNIIGPFFAVACKYVSLLKEHDGRRNGRGNEEEVEERKEEEEEELEKGCEKSHR